MALKKELAALKKYIGTDDPRFETQLNEMIHVVYWRANKRYDEILPKYELITTHAGR